MKITGFKITKVKSELYKPFKIAINTQFYSESILIKIVTDEGITGYGDCVPKQYITGESLETCPIVMEKLAQSLIGVNPIELCRVHDIMDKLFVGNTSAKAAIDIALHDIASKKLGVPLYKYLGGYGNKQLTDITIGIGTMDEMLEDARKIMKMGFEIIKIKIGQDANRDLGLVKQIRNAVGEDIKIHLDANQGYTVTEAIKFINSVEKFDIDAVEQPVKYWDFEGLKKVKSKINVPLLADESIHSPQDAMKLIQMGAVDGLNIKLMKCGGLYKAKQINDIAQAAGMECMVGSMIETNLSLSAMAAFAASQKNVTRADLDSPMLRKNNKMIKGGFYYEDGYAVCSEKNGIGVDVSF